eukprot:GGOE01028844.1.p2 GENE.GGOE01028844.1~~GGOE01028844.1.p2  ORF type:complete len:108 (+),score=1.32 GGOE01028844.1:440-763(+)
MRIELQCDFFAAHVPCFLLIHPGGKGVWRVACGKLLTPFAPPPLRPLYHTSGQQEGFHGTSLLPPRFPTAQAHWPVVQRTIPQGTCSTPRARWLYQTPCGAHTREFF